ncbi:ABC transporter permease [Athalassotoga saccharophila]|uniref:ABC transporter permease n=1 Tax=Athalassotoga saccharophila TaxID=1441386 RepID=UPI0018D7560D|nr:ABC transporter permease [Athalassotoga saccharophila]BBJ28447.1 putative D,D-dipeptide transport system permease protein DdpC [Athalassotoga saccharophila]
MTLTEKISDFMEKRRPILEDWKHTFFLWRRTKLAIIGTVIVIVFVLVAIIGPFFIPYDPLSQNMAERLQPPSLKHFFGTDQFGRDIFSRVVSGSMIEVEIIIIVSIISGGIGLILGVIAGYFGGAIDEILMRATDMFLAFPSLILAMAFAAMLGPSLINTIIAISLVGWTVFARLARAEAMKVKNQPYIEAIRALGASRTRIISIHVTPMCVSPVLVQLTLRMGTVILTAASLGFLGLGVRPPLPEWGAMVSDGRSFLLDQWWISTFPGIAIAIVVLGFNLLGDGLRDIMDPRLRR